MEIDLEDLLERLAEYRREQGVTIKQITEELSLPKTAIYNFTRTRQLKYVHQLTLDNYLEERGY